MSMIHLMRFFIKLNNCTMEPGFAWAGISSTPINTFLHKTDFNKKNVYIFLTQADEKCYKA